MTTPPPRGAEPAAPTWRRAAPHLLAILLYLALALLLTWPLALHLRTGVVGADAAVDSYQHTWHQWWVAEALTHAKDPFVTDLLYYPEGIDLFWQTLGFTQGLVALPVTLTLGSVAGVNFTVLSSFVIGGYAVFLLTLRLAGSRAGALVAGAIYAFSPYHLQKMTEGSIELTSIHWLPLYVWALDALLERPGWRRGLLAGALLLWVSLGAWYYGLFALLYSACAVGIRALGPLLPREGGAGRPRLSLSRERLLDAIRIGLWGALPVLIWVAVLSPKLLTINQSVDQTSWDMREAQITHSADLIDFVLPSPIHPLWGEAVREWRMARFPDLLTYWNISLGMVGLPLAALGLASAWRRSWRWGALLLCTMLMAMGPMLRLAGEQTGIPLPFALIQGLPGVRIGQRPSHMAVMTILMTAILAAYGVARLVRGRRPLAAAAIGAALIAGVLLVDGSVERGRLTIWERRPHPFYTTLPEPDGALMALPMYVNINRIDHMINQISHRWPIFAGYVARPPAYRYAFETDGVSQLREGRAERDDIVWPAWPESGRRALAAYRIRYVTLDLTTMRGGEKLAAGKPEYFAAVRELLGDLGVGAPLVADQDLEAYAIPRDWPVGPVAALGEGWRALERQPGSDLRWRWMGERATLRLYNPHGRPVVATVRLVAASFGAPRALRLSADGRPLASLPVGAQPEARSVSFMLPSGTTILVLEAPADPDPASGDQPTSVRLFGAAFRFSRPGEAQP